MIQIKRLVSCGSWALTASFALLISGCSPRADQVNIEGSAYLNSQVDVGSELLRGLKIFPCDSSLLNEFKDIRTKNELDDVSAYIGVIQLRYTAALSQMEKLAQGKCGSPVQTDVNGHYALSKLQPGSYLLFAVDWSSDTSDSQFRKYWLIPVEVKNRENVKVDFSSSNFGIDGML